MSTNYTYHRIIRKMVVAFGNLFNDIKLSRYDSTGKEVESFLVPILYGGKEKYVSRITDDPELDKKVQITLPIMSFELVDMQYDATRKQNTNLKTFAPGPNGNVNMQYNPVPFDFKFSLFAYVRNIEDGAQLMEKILPFFTPDYTVKINLIPEMGIVKQLPIILDDVKHENDYEGPYNSDVRRIIWTLNFTIKGFLYGPTQEKKIIRTAITNIIDNSFLGSRYLIFNTSNEVGSMKEGEVVYQGYSYETSYALGKVISSSPDVHQITVMDGEGNFVIGQPLIGVETNAKVTLTSYINSPVPTANVVITPNPVTANANSAYTYTTVITELPDL